MRGIRASVEPSPDSVTQGTVTSQLVVYLLPEPSTAFQTMVYTRPEPDSLRSARRPTVAPYAEPSQVSVTGTGAV